jgi:hypothetical protein
MEAPGFSRISRFEGTPRKGNASVTAPTTANARRGQKTNAIRPSEIGYRSLAAPGTGALRQAASTFTEGLQKKIL